MVIRERFSYKGIRQVLGGLLGEGLHAKRVSSLCDAILGIARQFGWPVSDSKRVRSLRVRKMA